jgi:hypothetical protein
MKKAKAKSSRELVTPLTSMRYKCLHVFALYNLMYISGDSILSPLAQVCRVGKAGNGYLCPACKVRAINACTFLHYII